MGVIEDIHAALIGTTLSLRNGTLNVTSIKDAEDNDQPGKRLKLSREPIEFRDENLERTTQPHDDALIITSRIWGFVVKIVLVDQGSGAEVMYPDLHKGLGLKPEDLSKYNTPLVGFNGKVVLPKGQISLPGNIEGKEVVVNFIVVNAFSSYIAILWGPWIHAMGVVPSTLHVKVKFHTEGGIAIVREDQQVARQCLVIAINHEIKQKEPIE